jgi:hypothetical protein
MNEQRAIGMPAPRLSRYGRAMADNPYQPPSAELGDAPLAGGGSVYAPPRTGLLWGLGLNAVASLASLVVLGWQDAILGEAIGADTIDASVAEASDTRVAAVSSVEWLSYLACIVLWGLWVVRAAHNARALDPSTPRRYTPGWAFGWYFVPFLNLVRPFQAMREIWAASGPSGDGLLSAWWAMWILSNLAGNVASRLEVSASPTFSELRSYGYISMVASLLGLFAAVVAFAVVRQMNAHQRGRHEQLTATTRRVQT